MALVGSAACQLSDGTLVFLEWDAANSTFRLYYSSDHSTANLALSVTPAGLNWSYAANTTTSCASEYALFRDASDNLYVVGSGWSGTVGCAMVQAFKKGAGYTWTQQGYQAGAGVAATMLTCFGTWCNTGTGTGNGGYVIFAGYSAGSGTMWQCCDAGALLAAAVGTTPAVAVNFLQNPTCSPGGIAGADSGQNIDISNDGFGATSGLIVGPNGSTTSLKVGYWAINSTGGFSTNTAIATNPAVPAMSATTKVRLIHSAAGVWTLVTQSGNGGGKLAASRWSSTAQLTAPTDQTTPAGFPAPGASLSWDCWLDSSTTGRIWVLGWTSAVAAIRLGISVASGVTWDAAATTDDTAIGSGTDSTLRAVKEPVSTNVDWQTFNTNGTAYALMGDYSAMNLPPTAPTLTAPANGATMDLSGAVTLSWTFNDPNAGDTQSAWALRRKVSGGSYQWWNATTAAWQSTEVFNSGSASSVTFPAGAWSDGGTVYNWSVNTQDNHGATGVYASDFTVTGAAPPAVTVNAPNGTTTVANPLVTWTYTAGTGGDPQQSCRVVIYSQAQYSAGGFTPGTSAATWDSGTITDANARQLQVGVNLANGTTYRAYVYIVEHVNASGGSIGSAWVYSAFTVTYDLPAQPGLLSVTMDNANNKATIVVQGKDNLLTQNQASLEAGTTAGWVAGANTTLAASTAQAEDGSYSLAVTTTAAGSVIADTAQGTAGVVVIPGQQYEVMLDPWAATAARSVTIGIRWYKSDGTASAHPLDYATANDAVGVWGHFYTGAAAPSDAAYAAVEIQIAGCGAGEVHYFDKIGIVPGTSTTWTRGGLVGSNSAYIEYSDDNGVTWHPLRNGLVPYSATTQQATVIDYEVPIGGTRIYRATTQANV